MDRLFIRDVRCFDGEHAARLAPVTVLVGENSTGKSTFLALVRLAANLFPGDPSYQTNFNEPPFELGAYDQIATLRMGKKGLSRSFALGAQRGTGDDGDEAQATFVSEHGQPRLQEFRFKRGGYSITRTREEGGERISVRTPSGSAAVHLSPPLAGFPLQMVPRLFAAGPTPPRLKFDGQIADQHASEFEALLFKAQAHPVFAFAPIRTSPRRTYDPVKEIDQPEGSHVPMVLARLNEEKSRYSTNLLELIAGFGEASGLFHRLQVRRKGTKPSDPFQILVNVEGATAFNLTDVGYGVSQSLPIVVDCLRAEAHTIFLLQQPEVHLHPRAQAALGSFLGAVSKVGHKRFVIETHSDYLLDRLRMDAREGKVLKPEDVSILYFERADRGAVRIHEMTLDSAGNLQNAPPSYRTFFLTEERRLLGS